jgi:hypothetical protein
MLSCLGIEQFGDENNESQEAEDREQKKVRKSMKLKLS